MGMNAVKTNNPYWQLSWAMIKTGVLGYGGGPSVIPLIHYEAVTHYKWLKDEEFGEILAIANALPGPIATKMAAYLGYRSKGIAGAVVSVLAHIAPSSIAMVVLLSTVQSFSGSAVIQGMIGAVIPVIAVMLGMMAYEFGERAVKGVGIYVGVALFALAFGLLQWVQLHPAIVIALFLGYGAFHMRASAAWRQRREVRRAAREQRAGQVGRQDQSPSGAEPQGAAEQSPSGTAQQGAAEQSPSGTAQQGAAEQPQSDAGRRGAEEQAISGVGQRRA